MWGYLTSGVELSACGAYFGSVQMMLFALWFVCGFRLYEESLQSRWAPVWTTLMEKLEVTAAETEPSDVIPDDTAPPS
jgi:hypothetical protein